MAKRTLKCSKCKASFLKEEIIKYKDINFCIDCYNKKLKSDEFVEEVCRIFNIISPGPRIYNDRKRLMAKGFTDDMIILTLKYVYNVQKVKPTVIGLGLVTLDNYIKAKSYQDKILTKQNNIVEAVNNQKMPINVISVSVQENNNSKNNNFINLDDESLLLDCED